MAAKTRRTRLQGLQVGGLLFVGGVFSGLKLLVVGAMCNGGLYKECTGSGSWGAGVVCGVLAVLGGVDTVGIS